MVLVNTSIFYFKNKICLYKLLHVLTPLGHQQAWINKNKGSYKYLPFYLYAPDDDP